MNTRTINEILFRLFLCVTFCAHLLVFCDCNLPMGNKIMSDNFSVNALPPLSTITPWSMEAFGSATSASLPASATYPSANRALFIPFQTETPIVIPSMICVNGTAVSGNIDMGIYSVDGRRLTSKGSTAQTGTSTLQRLTFTAPLSLGAGFYFMAFACDNTTATLLRRGLTAQAARALGMFQMATAFVLPATATFAAVASSFFPAMAIEVT